jgi:hypothetical protein
MPKLGARLDTIWAQYMNNIGRRGLMLFVLAIMFGLYGISLLTAAPGAGWWPVFGGDVIGVPIRVWGFTWVACSIFLLLGAPLERDSAHFAVAAGMSGLWAFAAIYTATYWGPGIIYSGLTLIILLCATWPDPRLVLLPPPHESLDSE